MLPFSLPGLLAVALLALDVTALPKASLISQRARAQGRKALAASFNKREELEPRGGCTVSSAAAITAPKTNIWADLTEAETKSVVGWLFEQKDLNLTTSDKAGSWDNTL